MRIPRLAIIVGVIVAVIVLVIAFFPLGMFDQNIIQTKVQVNGAYVYDSKTAPALSVARVGGVAISTINFYTGYTVSSKDYASFIVKNGGVNLVMEYLNPTGQWVPCGTDTVFYGAISPGQSAYPLGDYGLKYSASATSISGGSPWNTGVPTMSITGAYLAQYAVNKSCLQPCATSGCGGVSYRLKYGVTVAIEAVGVGTVPSAIYSQVVTFSYSLDVGSVSVTGGSLTG